MRPRGPGNEDDVDANDGAYHHRPFGLVLHEVFKCTNVVCLQYYSK